MSAKLSQRIAAEAARSAAPKRGSLRWVRNVLSRSLRLEQARPGIEPTFAQSQADTPLSLVMQQRAELGARLLVHDPATQIVRHLFIVHDELRNAGWPAVEALPATVVGRALVEAEILARDEPSPMLDTIIDALRAIKLAATARAAREAHEALEAEWEIPKVPEVSDTNFDEYELMERSWAGTVPAGLREAIRDTQR
jgi:hypothetical protein